MTTLPRARSEVLGRSGLTARQQQKMWSCAAGSAQAVGLAKQAWTWARDLGMGVAATHRQLLRAAPKDAEVPGLSNPLPQVSQYLHQGTTDCSEKGSRDGSDQRQTPGPKPWIWIKVWYQAWESASSRSRCEKCSSLKSRFGQ